MMADGVERALADAERALELLPPESDWRPTALRRPRHRARAARRHRSGADDLAAAVESGLASGAVEERLSSRRRSSRCSRRGRAPGTRPGARHGAAQALVEETGLGDYSTSAIAHVATARVALHEGRQEDARAALTRAHRLRPLLDHSFPWLTVEVGLELTRAHLALGEVAAARTVFAETEEVLELRPDLGSLVEDARELRERLAATSGSAGAWAMSLTGAELRLLPYLATHLTFPEIARGCSSRATPSRPRRSRSTASWVRPRAARRSSVRSRSGSWRSSKARYRVCRAACPTSARRSVRRSRARSDFPNSASGNTTYVIAMLVLAVFALVGLVASLVLPDDTKQRTASAAAPQHA